MIVAEVLMWSCHLVVWVHAWVEAIGGTRGISKGTRCLRMLLLHLMRIASCGVSDRVAWSGHCPAILTITLGQSLLAIHLMLVLVGLSLSGELGVALLDLVVVVGDRVDVEGLWDLLLLLAILSKLLRFAAGAALGSSGLGCRLPSLLLWLMLAR